MNPSNEYSVFKRTFSSNYAFSFSLIFHGFHSGLYFHSHSSECPFFYWQGLVAFSENGLMIRWWSLGSVWWEKISRNLTPVQCTKLIFVPPWEGFSPSSTRSSIMANVMLDADQSNSKVIFILVQQEIY